MQEKKIIVDEGDLIFSINDEVVNLAGIMGGVSTRCNDQTTKILLECAHFRPDEILGKSTKYGLNSDASQALQTQMYFSGNTFVIKTGAAGGQLLDNGGEYLYYAHA